jgi:hypothetical protein
MGYAHYGTPMGPAGYGITDVCFEDGCTTKIDRGLSYLCGMTPGRADEHGCGYWFCDAHLYAAPKSIDGYLCNDCTLQYDGVDDDEEEGVGNE